MSKLIVILYCFSLSLGLAAQGESDWWYFGNQAGLHFISDSVEVVFDGAMAAVYSNTTQSDENGNLLFYSDGGQVYSNNHTLMENGDGFSGESCISLKVGQNDSIYHLLYSAPYTYGINYKTINILSNNGLGVVSDIQELSELAHFYITATKQANGIDYWIVCREKYGNNYISYALTEDRLDTVNMVYSQAGDIFDPLTGETSPGHLRINPQGNLLAFSLDTEANIPGNISSGRCELFYFNNATGQVEERILKLDNSNVNTQYNRFNPSSTEFSPDGEKMYISGAWVFQCNIALLDSASIVQSMLRFNDYSQLYHLTGLQLAKDGKIYIGNQGFIWLSVIHQPNIAGIGAGFSFNGLDLSPNSGSHYLPQLDPSLFSSGFSVSNRCANDTTFFSLIYDMDYQYIHWDFGDGSTSIQWEPMHSYSNPGSYQVELISVIGLDTLVKQMEVIIEEQPSVNLGLDGSLLCDGDSIVLDASFYAGYYSWQDESYQPTYTVSQEGEYYVEVENICGVASDSISIVLDKDELNIGQDTLICIEQPIVLYANQASATEWLWQDGSTLPFYDAESEGDYFVLVNTPCYLLYDSIHVETENCNPIIPNIFTPNNDGINDKFEIHHLNQLGYQWSLEVYNRWGEQVFYSSSYKNKWDGDELSDGVYFYILRSINTLTSYKGTVTILRE